MTNDISSDLDFETHGQSDELVVVVHGLGGSRQALEGVRAALRAERPDADIYCPELAYSGTFGAFSRVPIERIVIQVMEAIRRHWDARKNVNPAGYSSITLVGHSLGGVIVRKIAILAYGETPGTPFESQFAAYRDPSPFAHAIHRIVMLAGLSRGWAVSSADSWATAFVWGVMEVIGEMLAWITGTHFTVFSVRRGAPFLVQTRLQWLALVMRPLHPSLSGKWKPAISPEALPRLESLCRDYSPRFDFVQLLGTQDDTVSPEDMLDNNVEMENTNYFIIEVPNSTHQQVIQMERPPADDRAIDQDKPEHQRYMQFKVALTKDRFELKMIAVDWEDVSDILPDEPEWDVTDVVFVIHGIRDKGYWTQKIARRVKQLARTNLASPKRITNLPYRSVTASYGYFAMVPFVLEPVRIRKVAWLMDQYTEARVRYPNAKFSYVGHSNGTYLVARALRDYAAAKFARIVFAGSVVRCDYDWEKYSKAADGEICRHSRVEKVLNYVATSDWVVAMFPKAMQLYRPIDLGGAGHDGFKQAFSLRQAKSIVEAEAALRAQPFVQLEYVEGSHDAAIRERHWGDIASFVVSGTLPWLSNPNPGTKQQQKTKDNFLGSPGVFAGNQPLLSRMLGKFSGIFFPVIVVLILGLGAWLGIRIFEVPPCLPANAVTCAADVTREVVTRIGIFLAYLVLLRIITTRY